MNAPHIYLKEEPFLTSHDVRHESGKENWAGVFGLLVFPILLLITAFSFYKVFTGQASSANLTYENGGFMNFGTQVGVGGGPPTVTPTRQSDLFVHNSNFIKGSADGFISREAYDSGARVYLNAQAMYEQNCSRSEQNTKESQNITINKGIDTYATRFNNQTNTDGYNWTVDFDLSAPMNLCPPGYVPGKITQTLVDGRVFLSRDGGITQLSDSETKVPLEVSLTP